MTPKQYAIAEALRDGYHTVSEIAEHLGRKPQSVRMTLRHLEAEGHVVETRTGRFNLTDSGSLNAFGSSDQVAAPPLDLYEDDEPEASPDPTPTRPKPMSMLEYIEQNPVRGGCLAVAALLVLILGIMGCSALETIQPGDVGVRTSWGTLHEKVYPNDWYFVWPWEEMTHCNVQAFTITVKAPANGMHAAVTKDKQALGYELHVIGQYNPSNVWLLYKHFGRDPKAWPQSIVQPLLPHCFKTASSQRTLDEAISDRTRLASDTAALLSTLLKEKLLLKGGKTDGVLLADVITINQVTVPSLGYSAEYQAVIEKTQRVQEEIREQRNQLVRYMVEQARSVVAAEAEQQAEIARSVGRALSKIIEFEAELTRMANLVRLGVDPNQIYTWDRLSEIASQWNGELPRFMNGDGEGMLPLRIPLDAATGDREITEANIELMLEGVQTRRAQLEQSLRDLREEQRALRESLMRATSNPKAADELLPDDLKDALEPGDDDDGTENPGGVDGSDTGEPDSGNTDNNTGGQ